MNTETLHKTMSPEAYAQLRSQLLHNALAQRQQSMRYFSLASIGPRWIKPGSVSVARMDQFVRALWHR